MNYFNEWNDVKAIHREGENRLKFEKLSILRLLYSNFTAFLLPEIFRLSLSESLRFGLRLRLKLF